MMSSHFLIKIKNRVQERHFEESFLFVSIGVVAAIVCSGYAQVFSMVENFSSKTFSAYPIASFILAPLALLISFLLVRLLAPGAAGSGIPQVLACIESSHRHLASVLLRKMIIVVKIFSSLAAIFAGAAIGREGPSLQISATISYHIGKFAERFGVKVKTDQLLVAGAASGLAAAFNTPIGGIVYAIEELSTEHVKTFRDILLLSVVIAGLTAQVISGNYLYLGYPVVLKNYNIETLSIIAMLGLLAGIAGSCFSKALIALIKWRSNLKLSKQIVLVILIGLLFATVFYFLGSGNLYSGKETINHILFSSSEVPFHEVVARIVMPLISSMNGIAGGIFAPSLSAGAALGSGIAEFFDPTLRTILALAGMVGFLTGVTHTPITSFILVLEMTDRHSAVFPMILAAVFSSLGAHLISDKSFYESSVQVLKEDDPDKPL